MTFSPYKKTWGDASKFIPICKQPEATPLLSIYSNVVVVVVGFSQLVSKEIEFLSHGYDLDLEFAGPKGLGPLPSPCAQVGSCHMSVAQCPRGLCPC